MPALTALFPNSNNNYKPNENIWFQQDGGPPHFAIDVSNYLNEVFSARWIGRRGLIEWLARSPDLTPLGNFFCGFI